MREKVVKLLNNNELDMVLVYNTYIEEGGKTMDMASFRQLFEQFLRVSRVSLEGIYRSLIVKYEIDLWYDSKGKLILIR